MTNKTDLLISLIKAGVGSVTGESSVSAALANSGISRSVHLLAIGKAAESMTTGALAAGIRPLSALLVSKHGHFSQLHHSNHIETMEASHPVPDKDSLQAGTRVEQYVSRLPNDAHLLFLVSGGASALAEKLVEGEDLAGLRRLNARALAQGWPIDRINRSRQEISQLKAGGLLTAFPGKRASVLYISDVRGDSIEVVGSGIGAPPKKDTGLDYRLDLVASNKRAREEITTVARHNGIEVQANAESLYGDVETVSKQLARQVENGAPGLYIFGGESTVILPKNPGEGGRNQLLALLFAREIAGCDDVVALFAGTDGTDGPTDAAGGLVDGHTFSSGGGAEDAINAANSGHYLQKTGARYVSGPTGTNVMDLALILKIR